MVVVPTMDFFSFTKNNFPKVMSWKAQIQLSGIDLTFFNDCTPINLSELGSRMLS